VAQQGRKDGHGDECGEGSSEDDHSVMAHCHECSDEEGFVANLGEEDHGEGEEEGVHGLDDCAWFFFGRWKGGFGVSIAWSAIIRLDRGILVRYRVFWRREVMRLLR
jgi:hypothetical protein